MNRSPDPQPGGPLADLEGYAYRFPLWQRHGDEDDCAAFLLYVHPRLQRHADRFVDQGKPFVAYLHACMHREWKSYCRRAMRERIMREAERDIAATLAVTDDTEPAAPWQPRTIDNSTIRARVVCAAVKAATELDDDQIAVLVASTGREDLPQLIERARACVDDARLQKVRDRARRLLARRIAADVPRRRLAYQRAVAEMRRVRIAPTHRQVASILSMPRGTVDTGLHHLHRSKLAA